METFDAKLYLADCAIVLPDIIKRTDGLSIIVTDPPFNVGYHYNEYTDNMKEDDYYEWLSSILTSVYPVVVVHYPEALYKLAYRMGRFPEKVVSWVYNSNTAKQHRDIAFFGIKPDFNKVKQPYKNPNDKRIKERIANGSGGAGYTTGGILTKLRMLVNLISTILALCRLRLWKRLSAFCQTM